MVFNQDRRYTCDHCQSMYSEAEYDELQTVCVCGHLIISHSHVLPSKRRLTKKQREDTCSALAVKSLTKRVDTCSALAVKCSTEHANTVGMELCQQEKQHQPSLNFTNKPKMVGCRRRCSRKCQPARACSKSPTLGQQPVCPQRNHSLQRSHDLKVVGCQRRHSRKSPPTGTFSTTPLFCATISPVFPIKVVNQQSPKRSIYQLCDSTTEIHVKHRRCSMRRCVAGA